jgi:hypothetical protein
VLDIQNPIPAFPEGSSFLKQKIKFDFHIQYSLVGVGYSKSYTSHP